MSGTSRADQDVELDEPARAPVAIVERVNPLDVDVGHNRLNDRFSRHLPAASREFHRQPCAEPVHEFRDIFVVRGHLGSDHAPGRGKLSRDGAEVLPEPTRYDTVKVLQ